MAAVGGMGAVAGRDDMEFEILMSCMNQEDFALIDQSNIRTNVLIVNQCGRDGMREETLDGVSRRMLDSSQKGLSRSRNAALQHARDQTHPTQNQTGSPCLRSQLIQLDRTV